MGDGEREKLWDGVILSDLTIRVPIRGSQLVLLVRRSKLTDGIRIECRPFNYKDEPAGPWRPFIRSEWPGLA
mgnify:CR=1 FL=1